ncbi:MAG: M24 family metallopeptidase, partial [Oscillospiraceae bacterium]|nr:M24 family metallopeptidase [Oscillospiraceae bacterium]
MISKKEEISKYYFHNISHHLGLDTHDPSLREMPLVEGNVITVEPGLYLEHLNIGVRIE